MSYQNKLHYFTFRNRNQRQCRGISIYHLSIYELAFDTCVGQHAQEDHVLSFYNDLSVGARASQNSTLDNGIAEIGVAEIGIAEIGFAEIGIAEVTSRQIHASQIHT